MKTYEATYNVPTLKRSMDNDGIENLDNPLCFILENRQKYRFTATDDAQAGMCAMTQLKELRIEQKKQWPQHELEQPTLEELAEVVRRIIPPPKFFQPLKH